MEKETLCFLNVHIAKMKKNQELDSSMNALETNGACA
jgi:hypothetical protein